MSRRVTIAQQPDPTIGWLSEQASKRKGRSAASFSNAGAGGALWPPGERFGSSREAHARVRVEHSGERMSYVGAEVRDSGAELREIGAEVDDYGADLRGTGAGLEGQGVE